MNQQAADPRMILAGAARQEITPPLEAGLLMSSVEGRWAPFEGVRRPLYARALALEQPSPEPNRRARPVALVSLDLLALAGKALGGFKQFKRNIAAAAGDCIAPEDIIVACTHTHTAPESGAITALYLTSAFAHWRERLIHQIGRAVAEAAAAREPCHVRRGASSAPGLGIHRRVKTTRGIMMSHPAPPEDLVISRDGPVDDSVNVLALVNESALPIALVVNATCHPVYEMCLPWISPDYPGELCSALEDDRPGSLALFFNGAAGNINPKYVSAGPEAAREHAARLARAVDDALERSQRIASPAPALRRRSFTLPTRLPGGEDTGIVIPTEVTALRLGNAALAFLPGEPFVETGLALRSASPFDFTAVVGCAEETIGYVPTDEAFADGGYEIGFGSWSILSPGSEAILRRQAAQALSELASSPGSPPTTPRIPAPHGFRAAPASSGDAAPRPAAKSSSEDSE
ncbi:MAG: hypothetical protein IT424_15470 [Pirellulales bacterium]|nr:hypothetical protein [Pirellulales bacterium]